jgi:hypothetical protein
VLAEQLAADRVPPIRAQLMSASHALSACANTLSQNPGGQVKGSPHSVTMTCLHDSSVEQPHRA